MPFAAFALPWNWIPDIGIVLLFVAMTITGRLISAVFSLLASVFIILAVFVVIPGWGYLVAFFFGPWFVFLFMAAVLCIRLSQRKTEYLFDREVTESLSFRDENRSAGCEEAWRQ